MIFYDYEKNTSISITLKKRTFELEIKIVIFSYNVSIPSTNGYIYAIYLYPVYLFCRGRRYNPSVVENLWLGRGRVVRVHRPAHHRHTHRAQRGTLQYRTTWSLLLATSSMFSAIGNRRLTSTSVCASFRRFLL